MSLCLASTHFVSVCLASVHCVFVLGICTLSLYLAYVHFVSVLGICTLCLCAWHMYTMYLVLGISTICFKKSTNCTTCNSCCFQFMQCSLPQNVAILDRTEKKSLLQSVFLTFLSQINFPKQEFVREKHEMLTHKMFPYTVSYKYYFYV